MGRIDWAKAYLCIALTVGILLVFVTPPFQNFDEAAHYYRSWSLAQGQLTPPSSGYVTMPASAAGLEYAFPIVPIATNQVRVRVSDILTQAKARISGAPSKSVSFSSSYGPLGYVPQALGFEIPRLIGRSPLAALYLGRLFNLLCSVALTYFAIRLLPFAKAVVFVFALLPMVLMQMASLSPDALLISGSFFFIALVLALTQVERLSTRQMIFLVASAVLLLNTKPGFAEMALLVFLLVPRQFGGVRRYSIVVAATLVLTGFTALVLQLVMPASREVLDLMLGAGNGVDAAQQVSHVLHHPLSFALALKHTMDANAIFYSKIMVSVFAWGNRAASDLIALLAALALAAVIAARDDFKLGAWRRAVIVGVALLTALVVCLGLYVSFSPVGAATISGLQGRYFVPSATFAFIGLAGFPFGRRWVMPLTVLLIVAFLLIATLRSILVYYY